MNLAQSHCMEIGEFSSPIMNISSPIKWFFKISVPLERFLVSLSVKFSLDAGPYQSY